MNDLTGFKAFNIRSKPGGELNNEISYQCCGEIDLQIKNVHFFIHPIKTDFKSNSPYGPGNMTDWFGMEIFDWCLNLHDSNIEHILSLNVETHPDGRDFPRQEIEITPLKIPE